MMLAWHLSHTLCRKFLPSADRSSALFRTVAQVGTPNIVMMVNSRRLRWAGSVARVEEGRRGFKILTGIPTEKRPLGRHRRRWEELILKK